MPDTTKTHIDAAVAFYSLAGVTPVSPDFHVILHPWAFTGGYDFPVVLLPPRPFSRLVSCIVIVALCATGRRCTVGCLFGSLLRYPNVLLWLTSLAARRCWVKCLFPDLRAVMSLFQLRK